MKTKVWVTLSFIGFHCWPAAPEPVKYLRNLHRHKFNVKVFAYVNHSDREIEFHTLKAQATLALHEMVIPELNSSQHLSCEMIAEALFLELRRTHNVICSDIHVDEDGECGAEVNFQ